MKLILSASMVGLLLSGCANIKSNTLYAEDRIDLIKAYDSNPYPPCDHDISSLRVADLSVSRSERVYMKDGELCR